MQINKAKYHLKRIETILNLHEDKLSPMDRDILLEDIRQLYEVVIFTNEGPNADPNVPTPTRIVNTPTETTTTVEAPENPRNQPHAIAENPFVDSKVQKNENDEKPAGETWSRRSEFDSPADSPSTPATITYEESSGSVKEENGITQSDQRASAPTAPNIENGSTSELHEQDEDVLVETKENYPELFEFKISSDLSDRLGNTRIQNLNGVMTINDKILYINHLFGGEAIPFQESVKKFESFYTYDEARSYACQELVETYNWTDGEKKDTVRQFMQQVKRLYN